MDKIIDKIVEKQRGRDKRTPVHPDPLWPEGAKPLHLSMEQRAAAIEIGAFVELKGEEWHCVKCNTVDKPSKEKPEMCVDCAILDSKQTALARKTNSTWMELASEYGLELFERQPEESDTDWRIWLTYISYYPGKLPTYSALAEEANCSAGTVVNASQRWSYKIRILAWARYCDAENQQTRVERVREMNDKQLSLSARMLAKVSEAIDLISPDQLRPGEIASLFKIATDLERKAVMLVDEVIDQPAIQDKTATAKALTKLEDIQEIAAILKKAGALDGKDIAVETSTRIIVRGGDND